MVSDGEGVHVGGEEAVGARDVPNLHSPLGKTPPSSSFPFLELGDGVARACQAKTKTKGEHVTLPIPMRVSRLTDQAPPSHVLLTKGAQGFRVYLVHDRRLVVSVQGAVEGVNRDHGVVGHHSTSRKSS